MKHIPRITLSIALLLLVSCQSTQAEKIRVSVAASMTDVFKEIISTFKKLHPEIEIYPNFGPSGGLAKQIQMGAPADLYVSANPKWMQYLERQNKIVLSSKKIFAHNTLVFIGQGKHPISALNDLLKFDKIGIGSPGSVPAGQYARQALEKMGIYNQLVEEKRLVLAKDVRQALIYAERGETDGSFVYKTDALLASKAVILYTVPADLHRTISYPLALTHGGSKKTEAMLFYTFVLSDTSSDILSRYGFTQLKI